MKKQTAIAAIGFAILAIAGLMVAGFPKRAMATDKPEKYLHVRVNESEDDEKVSVNVPLSLAEKILPAIHHGELHDGKVKIGQHDMGAADVKQILSAVASAPDGEFVTIQKKDEEVRVAKSKGNLIVHVVDTSKGEGKEKGVKGGEKVEVTVPLSVVNALISADQQELNIGAALRALSDAGDSLLVTVHDATNDVRVWVDSKSSTD